MRMGGNNLISAFLLRRHLPYLPVALGRADVAVLHPHVESTRPNGKPETDTLRSNAAGAADRQPPRSFDMHPILGTWGASYGHPMPCMIYHFGSMLREQGRFNPTVPRCTVSGSGTERIPRPGPDRHDGEEVFWRVYRSWPSCSIPPSSHPPGRPTPPAVPRSVQRLGYDT